MADIAGTEGISTGPFVMAVVRVGCLQEGRPDRLAEVFEAVARQTHEVDALIAVVDSGDAVQRANEAAYDIADVIVRVDGHPLAPEVIKVAYDALLKCYHTDTFHVQLDSPNLYVWTIDSDVVPSRNALAELLFQARRHPMAGIVGGKQVASSSPDFLIDVGLVRTCEGRFVSGADDFERDQGQFDYRAHVAAVSQPGMLIRGDALRTLGAPDPALPEEAATVDLCHRARQWGFDVIVAPQAVMHHHLDHARLPWFTRSEHVHMRLVHCSLWMLPVIAVTCIVGGMLRLFGRIALKEPTRGWEDFTGSLKAVCNVTAVRRARSLRSAAVATRGRPAATSADAQLDLGDTMRWHRDRIRWVFRDQPKSVRYPWQRRFAWRQWVPHTLILLAVALISVVRWWPFLRAGTVSGGAIGAMPSAASALWDAAFTTRIASGLGSVGVGDPGLGIWAIASWLLGDNPTAAVLFALVVTPVIAAASALIATRGLGASVSVQLWTALAWSAMPALWTSLHRGNILGAMAFGCLPLFVAATARAIRAESNRTALRPAACAGLVAAGISLANYPLGWGLIATSLVIAIVNRRPVLARWWQVLIASSFLVPFTVAAARAGGWRAIGADLGLPTFAMREQPAAWLLGRADQTQGAPTLFGMSLPEGLVPLVTMCLGVIPLVLAVMTVACWRKLSARARTAVIGGWGVAAVAVLLSGASGRFPVGTDGARVVASSNAPWVVCAAGALIVVAAVLVQLLANVTSRRRVTRFVRVMGLVTLLTLGLVQLLLVPVTTSVKAGSEAIRPTLPPDIPLVAERAARTSDGTRTLLIRQVDGSYATSVYGIFGTTLAATSTIANARTHESDAERVAAERVAAATASLTQGSPLARKQLLDLGIGFVATPDALTSQLSQSIASVPGIVSAGQSNGQTAWLVEPPSGNAQAVDRAVMARLESAGGTPLAVLPALAGRQWQVDVPADANARRLRFATPRDSHWRAFGDGAALEAVTVDGWAQGFVVPANVTTVSVEYHAPWRWWLRLTQAVLLTLAVLMLAPVTRRPGLRRIDRAAAAHFDPQPGGPIELEPTSGRLSTRRPVSPTVVVAPNAPGAVDVNVPQGSSKKGQP